MHFSFSLEPVIHYLNQHPHTGFIAAFLIAFLESLPIIGAIIPGSVTMTAMGTMIGSAVLPAYSTFGWAIIGALTGDSISYIAGFKYHHQLRNMWPLKRYPKLFTFGEQFFKKHGGKSLVIGRFVGPMRSAIPLVAGIMQMTRVRFFVGAIPSAILWALAYMLPGVLIGAISQELPHGKAAEFILGFILLIVAFWLIMWLVKFSIVYVMRTFNYIMRHTWDWLKAKKATHGITLWLQQHDNPHEHKPLNYILLSTLSWVLFFMFLYATLHRGRFATWNEPLFYLLQSVHTKIISIICVWITLLAEKTVVIATTLLLCIWLFWQGYRRTAYYCFGLMLCTMLSVGVFKTLFYHPRPGGLNHFITTSSFPSGHTTLAMSLFGFLTYLFTHRIHARIWHSVQYGIALTLIMLVAFSRLYLGAHWLLDVAGGLSLGSALLFLVVIIYRRFPCEKIPPRKLTLVVSICLIVPWISYGLLRAKTITQQFLPAWPHRTIKVNSWWQQPTEKLPIYRLSRLGHAAQPFNVQWAGNITKIDSQLKNLGWQRYPHEEKLKSMVERLITLKPSKHMPLFPPLFHNRPPKAVFIKNLADKNVILELRLWQSDAHLQQTKTPIWLGNISYHSAGKKIIALKSKDRSHYQILDALDYLKPQDKTEKWRIYKTSNFNQPLAIRQLAWDGQILLRQSPPNK